MKTIDVKLKGRFNQSFNDKPKGTPVIIDKIKGDSYSNILVRVINIWKKPQWFGSSWFDFK